MKHTSNENHEFPRIILIEGIPGSGKTSLAESVCDHLCSTGTPSVWFREEARDHPVIGIDMRQTASKANYASRCVQGWRDFVNSNAHEGKTYVLEGCFFQSTIRYLLEHQHPHQEIDDYIAGFLSAVENTDVSLIYLRQEISGRILLNQMIDRKGLDIVNKIANYTENTPYAQARKLRGQEAVASLYTDYRQLCDKLVGQLNIPTLVVDAFHSSHQQVYDSTLLWVESIID